MKFVLRNGTSSSWEMNFPTQNNCCREMNFPAISWLVLFCLIAFWPSAQAQDIHFSQFNNAPANLNPALTGVFEGNLRFIANYRSQWNTVPVSYRTVAAAMDAKLAHKLLGDGNYLGYGLLFNNDVAGDADLGMSKLAGNLAYIRQMSDVLFVSVGLQVSLGQRSVSPHQLTYEEQWNGDVFDPTLPNNEAFSNTSKGIASFTTGLNLHFKMEDSRTRMDVGSSVFHLNKPNTSFFGEPSVELPRKFTTYFLSTFELQPKLDLRANAQFSKQLAYKEAVVGAALRYHLSTEEGKELNAQLGLSYRLGDAWIPTAELQFHNWTVGFSYDQNCSPFKVATNQRGGPEFFLKYILKKVAPPKEFKACPVF
jgi:type IX secretion system PorP/SprF family membrane protein